MTRDEMNKLVLTSTNKEFLSEVRNLLDVDDREYAYDAVSAAFDAEDRAEGWIVDGNSPDARKVRAGAREALIAIGFYRVMTQDEIDNTFVSSGRSKWNFKLKGVPYTSDDQIVEKWQWPPDGV